mmetsp:Transcript_24460/g.38130  ORF Transcript_24460/g.38130 Transcript_24460/m.38130 type:complete len:666 (+) Transcript_24460:353-2350(+)
MRAVDVKRSAKRRRRSLKKRSSPHRVHHGWVLGDERRQEVRRVRGLGRGLVGSHLGGSMLLSFLGSMLGSVLREVEGILRVLEAAVHAVVRSTTHPLLLRKLGVFRIRVCVTIPKLSVPVDGGGASLTSSVNSVLRTVLRRVALVLLGERTRVVPEVLIEHGISHSWVRHSIGIRRERVVRERGLLVSAHHVRAIHGRKVGRGREGVGLEVGHSLCHVNTSSVLGSRGVLSSTSLLGLHIGGEENSGHLLGSIRGVENLGERRVIEVFKVRALLAWEANVLALSRCLLEGSLGRSLVFIGGLLFFSRNFRLVLNRSGISFLILHRSRIFHNSLLNSDVFLLFLNFLRSIRTKSELISIRVSRKTRGKEKGIRPTDLVQVNLRLFILLGLHRLFHSLFNGLLINLFRLFVLLFNRGFFNSVFGGLFGGDLQVVHFRDRVFRLLVLGGLFLGLFLLGNGGLLRWLLGLGRTLLGGELLRLHWGLCCLLCLDFLHLSSFCPISLETRNSRSGRGSWRGGLGTVHFLLGLGLLLLLVLLLVSMVRVLLRSLLLVVWLLSLLGLGLLGLGRSLLWLGLMGLGGSLLLSLLVLLLVLLLGLLVLLLLVLLLLPRVSLWGPLTISSLALVPLITSRRSPRLSRLILISFSTILVGVGVSRSIIRSLLILFVL